jgi:hypothetical protein
MNASFVSVGKAMGRERLICNGKGAPRSLVRKELRGSFSGLKDAFNWDMSDAKDSFSAVEGYPRSS